MNYFTSDLHLNHKNIMKYCNRPFSSVEKMNETIINNFNSVLKSNDTLYILGDVGFGDVEFINNLLDKINCDKVLITGNHDKHLLRDYNFRKKFKEIREIKVIKDNVYGQVTLCHYPMLSWDASFHGSYHLYGHIHNTELEYQPKNSFNVGVDIWDFKPVTLKQIIGK